MPWLEIAQIVWLIIKLIFGLPMTAMQRTALLVRLRTAKLKAKRTGDTSDLEAILSDLRGDHRRV